MTDKKKQIKSLKEFGEEFYKVNPDYEKYKTLLYYGVSIPLEEMPNIEILEKTNKTITFLNKKTNEITTSDLMVRVNPRYQSSYSVSLTTTNPEKTFFIEHFHSISPVNSYEKAGLNALKSRKCYDRKLFSRAYQDVNTKYGDLCFHVEEGFRNNDYGSYRQLSLYHGTHDQVLKEWMNDFDFNNNCLFRWKYYNLGDFNQWMMGYNPDEFKNPNINIWSYDMSVKDNNVIREPIYAFDTANGSGVILLDGSIKLKENKNSIPESFTSPEIRSLVEDKENLDSTSKAYFANRKEAITILKIGSNIKIEHKRYDISKEEWIKISNNTLSSKTNQEFTKDDFEQISSIIDTLEISENMNKLVKRSLAGYTNTHDENDFRRIKQFSLKPVHFDTMVKVMKENDLKELVEESLDTLSEIFQIPVEEILGQEEYQRIYTK